jgi:cell division protein FtsA
MPVRLASPQGVTGMTELIKNPVYSTGIGLLLYGKKQSEFGTANKKQRAEPQRSFFDKMKSWVKVNF